MSELINDPVYKHYVKVDLQKAEKRIEAEKRKAEAERKRADEEKKNAEAQRKRADEEKKNAEAQRIKVLALQKKLAELGISVE
jgi:membrane protein involved in colicin uptake